MINDWYDLLVYRNFEFDNQINRNINSLTSYVGLGLKYQNTHFKPTVNPEIDENIFSLDSYAFNAIQLDAHYVYNTMNEVLFSTKGSSIKANISRSVYNNVEVKFSNDNLPNQNSDIEYYLPVHRL